MLTVDCLLGTKINCVNSRYRCPSESLYIENVLTPSITLSHPLSNIVPCNKNREFVSVFINHYMLLA